MQPQQQYGQPTPAADPFSDPTGGGNNPHLRNLEGRTVVIRPISVDETAVFKGQSRPSAYFDLVVVDGGPGTFGENMETGTPATHAFSAPAYFPGSLSGSVGVVDVCRKNAGGLVVGVVQRGQKGNRPWLITKVATDIDGNPRPDSEQRRAAARDLWFKIQAGEFRATVPQLLNAGPPAGSVNYGQVSYPSAPAQAQYAQPAQQYVGASGAAYPLPPAQQQPSYAGMAYDPGQGYAQSTASPVYVEQRNAAPAAPVAPTQNVAQGPPNGNPLTQQHDAPPVPPGWDAQAWANFPPEAQRNIWAQINAQSQNVQPQAQHGQSTAPASGPPTGW